MANGIYNLNLGTFTEVGAGRFLQKAGADTQGVMTSAGLLVSQRGAGANKSVDIAAGDALITTIAGTAVYHGFETATTNKTVTDNASGNPRVDAVSAYVDTAAYGASDNSGALKFKVTAGTPAASPVAPVDATIQSDVGAGNPFMRLADVWVPNGATQIVNANNGTDGYIEDRRTFAQSPDVVERDYKALPERVINGLQPATSASLVSDISIGIAYVRGRKVEIGRTESRTYTLNTTTWVDIANTLAADTGFFRYTENASEPAVAANSIRLAKVVTSGTAVTTVTDLRNLYAERSAGNTAILDLTTTPTVIPGLAVTFSVSQTSKVFVMGSADFDLTAGTAACNLDDALTLRLTVDTVDDPLTTFFACVVASRGRVRQTATWPITLTPGNHTIELKASNVTGNRGRVQFVTNARCHLVWRVVPY
jgi:hypothetical protein